MKIVFYRYGSICEPDMIEAFQQVGLEVVEETTEITNKNISPATQLKLVEERIKKEQPLFVFSINFYPVIADVCSIYKTRYLCWTVDSPVPELFSKSITHDTNRIFLFDGGQYEDFAAYNPEHIFHLPLAAASGRFDKVIRTITLQDKQTYGADISFVGSLYSEKDFLQDSSKLTEYTRGFLQALTEATLQIYGDYIAKDAISDKVVAEIKEAFPNFYTPHNPVANSDKYVAAFRYLGYHIAYEERIRTLNLLAKLFPVTLFTRSDTTPLQDVICRPGIRTLDEMPKVFHLSKINLNMTVRPIQTGLPLRIFDILGCGGFLMTNYQAELEELFEIGVDLEAYGSPEELVDKCNYYLTHEEERERIAKKGYETVKEKHTYLSRIKAMVGVME